MSWAVYGYGEFGRETSFEGRYSKQGVNQPFGYTGYRYDVVGGTYFAQAREYQPAYGRFLAEDSKRGRAAAPKTRNRYGYCWNNPVGMVDLNGMEPEVPSVEIKLPSLIPQEESIEPQMPEFVNPFAPVEEKKPASDFFDLEEYMSTIQAAPPEPVTAPVEEDFGDGITAGIREATKDWNGVGLVSLTGSIGSGEYLSGGVQIAVDWHGNIEIYPVYGTGVQAGASGKFNVGVGFLAVPTTEDAKGFGLEMGGSLGLAGIIPGVSWITANEDDGEYIASGGMFNVGWGANPTVAEAHVSMSHSLNIFDKKFKSRINIYDVIDNIGFMVEKII